MSLFVGLMFVVCGLLSAISIALLERLRVEMRRQIAPLGSRDESRSAISSPPTLPAPQVLKLDRSPAMCRQSESPSATEIQVANYRQMLDDVADDLDRDIAEWEAVLDDFPRTFGHINSLADDDVDPFRLEPGLSSIPFGDANLPARTRHVESEERGQIVRLTKSGFAPEEIALLLNLPLERVQEIVISH